MTIHDERIHQTRLRQKDVNILTEYHDSEGIRRRNTDGSRKEDVRNGVILTKIYYRGQKAIRRETEFNPGIVYSYAFPPGTDGKMHCPGCGAESAAEDFEDGCPFCGLTCCLDYSEKGLGVLGHGDAVIRKTHGGLLALCLGGGAGAGLLLYLTAHGRTMGIFDLLKWVFPGILVGLFLFLLLYRKSVSEDRTAEGMAKKAAQEEELARFRKELAAENLTLTDFFNAQNRCLGAWFFREEEEVEDVVDFDVLDCRKPEVYRDGEGLHLRAETGLRVMRSKLGRILAEEGTWEVVLRQNPAPGALLKPGVNAASCPDCGGPVDLKTHRCNFCGRAFSYEPPFIPESIRLISRGNVV